MNLVDHFFVLIIAIAYPIYCAVSYRRYVHKIEAGEAANPVKTYRETMIHQWIALSVLSIAWDALGRPIADLGLVTPGGTKFYLGVVLLVLFCASLVYSLRSVERMTEERRAKHVKGLGDLAHFLPRTEREFRSFCWLSMTAGIVEEMVYRGFLIWYLGHFTTFWAAVIISSVIFGFGHGYQGVNGLLRAGLVGLAFAVYCVFTGSLWLPMIAHALFDILQGKMLLALFRDS